MGIERTTRAILIETQVDAYKTNYNYPRLVIMPYPSIRLDRCGGWPVISIMSIKDNSNLCGSTRLLWANLLWYEVSICIHFDL